MQYTLTAGNLLTKKRVLKQELIEFYLFLFLTLVFSYYVPKIVTQLYYISLLFVFWNSKKNYYWFAFVLFLYFAPGGLFKAYELTQGKGIAFYNIASGVTFNFFDLFAVTALLKAMTKKRKNIPFLFLKELNPIFILAFVVLVFSEIYGTKVKTTIALIRFWMPVTFIYSIPRLFNSKNEFFRFLYLILPSAYLIFIFQIMLALFHTNILALLTGNTEFNDIYGTIIKGDNVIRATNFFTENILTNIIFSLMMLFTKNKLFSKKYLQSIVVISILSIIISATRQWMFSVLFGVVYYFIFISKKRLIFFIRGVLFLLLLISMVFSIPPMKRLVTASFGRFETLEIISKEGVQTESSANMRFNVRLPYALNKIAKSPVFGLGFTNEFILTPRYIKGIQFTSPSGDMHTGNFNLLANIGIVGFLVFIVFWVRVIRKMLKGIKKSSPKYKMAIQIMLMFYWIFLMVHFISYQFFGLTQTAVQNYFMVVYYFLLSILIYNGTKVKFEQTN